MEKTYQCFVMIKPFLSTVYSNLTETLVSKHKHQTMTAIKMRKHVKTVKFKLNLMSHYLKILVILMKMLKVGLWRV